MCLIIRWCKLATNASKQQVAIPSAMINSLAQFFDSSKEWEDSFGVRRTQVVW